MPDRRAFVLGGVATGTFATFGTIAAAIAAKPEPAEPPPGWRVFHRRADGVTTTYDGVAALGGRRPVTLFFRDKRRPSFSLPTGTYWVERGGLPLIGRQRC